MAPTFLKEKLSKAEPSPLNGDQPEPLGTTAEINMNLPWISHAYHQLLIVRAIQVMAI